MAHPNAQTFATMVQRLFEALVQDHRLAAELQRARRSWFGASGRHGDAAAELRFSEWFSLERVSEVLGAVPAEVPPFSRLVDDHESSLAGVFAVVDAGRGTALLRDQQDQGLHEVLDPDGALRKGDLVAGRLFQAPAGMVPSLAAAVFRPGAALGDAFRADVEQAELDRRLQQIEVEHLLLRRPEAQATAVGAAAADPVPIEHLEARLDQLLRAGGSTASAAAIRERLRSAARPGAVLGPLLDELAFDSVVDLDATRQVLVELWNAHHPDRAAAQAVASEAPPAGLPLGAELAQKLDAGLAAHRDVEELFAELEKLAGIEPEGEGDLDEDAGDSPDPGGDLEPMVQEYLWQASRESTALPSGAAEVLAELVRLQHEGPVVRPDLDQVTPADFDRLLLHVYLGAAADARAAAVQRAHAAVMAFFAWAGAELERQELVALTAGPAPELLGEAERLAAAGVGLSTPPTARARPELFQVEDLGSAGFGARDDAGEHHWFACPRPVATGLRIGDLVLGSRSGGGAQATLSGPVVVLPAGARACLE